MPSKHPASDSYPIGSARDKKGKYDHPVLSQPSTNHSDQLHGQEQVPESPASNEVHPDEVVRKPTPLMDQSSDAREQLQLVSTKEVLSNGDESRDSDPANRVSCQSTEDGLGPMVVAAECSDLAKEGALIVRDSDQDFSYQSRGDEPGPMDVSAELGLQSKEDEVGKSIETTESVEACHSSLPNVQPESDHEFNQPKHSASSDHNSLKPQEKESQELIPMSCDEYETSPKSTHSVDSLKVRAESERDGSVNCQYTAPKEVHHPEEPSTTCDDPIDIDSVVQAPGHATSRFQDQSQDPELMLKQSPFVDHHKLVMNQGRGSQLAVGAVGKDKATEQDRPVVNQQYPARQQCVSQSEDRATDPNQQMGTMTPSTSISMSGGQQPASSQPVSYAQQNMNLTPPTSQQHWQEQQSLAMNQMMLQYHYQQQQLLQQQYQQQLQMQHPYYQMQHQYTNQQPYQVQPNQQQQSQHPQIQQGHEPHQQSQDVAYQAHQLAYQQQASQEQQQLLWQQQYQQYQGYQLLQQQEQGSMNTQGHNVRHHPQDEQLQQYLQQAHSQQKFTQRMSQNQQVCSVTFAVESIIVGALVVHDVCVQIHPDPPISHLSLHSLQGTPDYAAVGASLSPPLGARSPQASQ